MKQNDYFSLNYDNSQISQVVQAMVEEEFEASGEIIKEEKCRQIVSCSRW